MSDAGFAYRLRITRNCHTPEIRFDVLSTALPIHLSARFDDSPGPHYAVLSAERLSSLLGEAFGRDEADKMLSESMPGQPIERNFSPLVSVDLRQRFAESDS